MKTRTKELIDEIVDAHKMTWGKLDYVNDEQARVRAANGILVTLDYQKVFAPSPAAKSNEPTTESKSAPPANAPTKRAPPASSGEREPGRPYTPKDATKGRIPTAELMGMPFWEGSYDRNGLKFNHCPNCDNPEIAAFSEAKQKHYQSCLECRLFLNPDGTAGTMSETYRGR